jgi:O-antigen/teichoic acid export membrane protein
MNRFIRDAFILALGQGGTIGATLLYSICAARTLQPVGYGQWVLIVATFTLLSSFLSFRTSDALTSCWLDERFDKGGRSLLLSAALYAEIATKLIAALASLVLMLWLARTKYAGPGDLTILLVVFAKSLGLLAPIWFSITRASRRMQSLATLPAAQAWLQLTTVLIAFHFLGPTLLSAAVALLVTELAGLIARAVSLKRQLRQSPDCRVTPVRMVLDGRSQLHPFWNMMGSSYVSSCLSSLIKEADTVVIGWVGTPALAGFYRLAKSLVTTLQTAVSVFSSLVVQDFAEAVRRRQLARVKRLLSRMFPLCILFALVSSIAGWFWIDEIIAIALGPSYAGARTPFLLLLPGVAVSVALFWVQPLAVALQSSSTLLRATALNFALYLLTLVLGVWLFGPQGVALALSVAWGAGHLILLKGIWPELRSRAEERNP